MTDFEAPVDKSIRNIMQQMTRDAKRTYDRIVFEMVRGGVGFSGWEIANLLEAEFHEAAQQVHRSELIPVQCESAADVEGIMSLLEAIGCRRYSVSGEASKYLVVRRLVNTSDSTRSGRSCSTETSRVDHGGEISPPFLQYGVTICDDSASHKIESGAPRLS
ncbi:MAG: hypothetical protein U0941_02710 [Planctomycetaceae bacterium]